MKRKGNKGKRLLQVLFLGALLFLGVRWYNAAPTQPHPVFSPGVVLPRVIAHRGGAGIGPENTLPTFRHALRIHTDVLEMDVRRSKDGVLVVMHDPTVDRTTEGHGRVDALNADELRALDAGYHWQSAAGDDYPRRGTGYRIPTFREVASEFSDIPMVVEIKSKHPDAPGELCEIITDHGMEGLVMVGSFSTATLEAFREACPTVGTSAGSTEALQFFLESGLRSQWLSNAAMKALQLPPRTQVFDVVTPHLVSAAHERGLAVDVWTINDPQEMRRFIDMGVDGIITNYPDVLGGVLEEIARRTGSAAN